MLGAQELGERLHRVTLWGRESRGRCLQGGRVPEGFPPTWFQTARPSHPPAHPAHLPGFDFSVALANIQTLFIEHHCPPHPTV